MIGNKSQLDRYRSVIESWIAEGKTTNQIISSLRDLGISTTDRTLRRAKNRWGTSTQAVIDGIDETVSSSFTQIGNTASIQGSPSQLDESPEDLMRERGLDPEDWAVTHTSIIKRETNSKDGKVVLSTLKVSLKRKTPTDFVYPARTEGFQAPKHFAVPSSIEPELVVVVGDEQAPYQDRRYEACFNMFLAAEKPHRGVSIGDTIDLPDISRHVDNPEWHFSVQECIDEGYLMLRRRVEASLATRWIKLLGNHDIRIRSEILNRAERLYGIRRAQLPGEDPEDTVLSIRNLLRLDELGIDLVVPNGNYEHAQYNICDKLTAIHGHLTGKDAAIKSIARTDHSIVQGHGHMQTLSHKTVYDNQGNPYSIPAIMIGCMAQIKGGLGYAVRPDWVNGGATFSIWPDGSFHYDFIRYEDGVMWWRDQRYESQ